MTNTPTTVVVTPPCPVCNRTSTYDLDAKKVERWRKGELIQNVFPELSENDRERLISGTHGECWDKLFEGFDD